MGSFLLFQSDEAKRMNLSKVKTIRENLTQMEVYSFPC